MDECHIPDFDPIQVNYLDFSLWGQAVRALPSGKAAGLYGWTYEEFQTLPSKCIHDLAKIYHHLLPFGFNNAWMHAKTVLLAKIPIPTYINHVRPITILSYIYRLMGKIIFM